jgi:hypothetical protein
VILSLDQLRALAELKRKQVALAEAQAAYLSAEAACSHIGISHRQIAAIIAPRPRKLPLGEASVYRRNRGQETATPLDGAPRSQVPDPASGGISQ